MKIFPATLRGTVTPPRSKSVLHRELICQALCGQALRVDEESEDVQTTLRALEALRRGEILIDCGESGSTLRFLLPVAAAMGRVGTTFTGSFRLLQRPVPAGLPLARTEKGWRIESPLQSGVYRLDGSRTSQMTSGLLLALPLLEGDSLLYAEAPVSSGYVDLTVSILGRYGIRVEKTPDGYRIPGGQQYCVTALKNEMDWSAAAWYAAVNRLGMQVYINGYQEESHQPDRAIINYVNDLPEVIDISQTPDIFPVLSLLAALQTGKTTRLIRCGFLRDKESDRLQNTFAILRALGVEAERSGESLTVHGRHRLQGGAVIDPRGDHRMAFLAAFAALFCDSAITLQDPLCVKKSYPRFWEDYAALGGKYEE